MDVPDYDENAGLRCAAYHEAGHAILLIYLGQKIARIKIRSDGAGRTESLGCMSLDQRIMVLQAGAACLDVFDIPSPDAGGAERDYGEVVTLLERHLPGTSEEERDKIELRLRKLTIEFFNNSVIKSGVEALSLELMRNRVIDGSRIHEIIDPAISLLVQASMNEMKN